MTPALPPLTLVLGGARSGKSRHAEDFVTKAPPPWIYVATAEAGDEEMAKRIAGHRERRGEGWTTIEAPVDLPGALRSLGESGVPVLVDCLTLWLSNIMLSGRPVAAEIDALLASLARARCPVVAVSSEVGLGIVPDNALARAFRDAQGLMNHRVAELADHVVFIAAGLPITLKEP